MIKLEYSLQHSQVGLPSLATYMIFATFHLKDEIVKWPLSAFNDLRNIEFFITMFPDHQEQHKRKSIFTTGKKK